MEYTLFSGLCQEDYIPNSDTSFCPLPMLEKHRNKGRQSKSSQLFY